MRSTIKTRHERRRAGFTLIELMIVLVIAAILAAVAYPSYQEYVRRTKRANAQAALMRLMQQQERYFSQNNTYIAFSESSTDENARKFTWYLGTSAAKSPYEINGAACQDDSISNCIVLTATPGTNKVDAGFSDPHCGSLSLTSTGKKTASANAADCWR
jgi:type IV pilus assembly protein PilE